jgi:DNA-binding NarL/FixJ family response regulator
MRVSRRSSEGAKVARRPNALPCHDVAAAYLSLFDAFVARRQHRTESAREHAVVAIQRFEMLGWHGFANIARSQLPVEKADRKAAVPGIVTTVTRLPLTVREQQVAELVIEGLTNREIASQLAITKHTVDSHVASIIERLGVRSRHQLADVIPAGP